MKSRPIGVQSILATDHNTRRDDARGGSFLLAHQQLGALALGTTPTNGQTVTFVVNGTSVVFTAVTGTPTNPGDVKAPGTALGFVTNLIVALRRPDLTTSTFIALSGPNQALIQYAGWAWPGASTNIVPFSLNKNVNGASASLTSFNITTTVTSGSWTAQTMQLYIEDGTYYINGTRYLFTGGSTPTVTGPASNPRVDVLTIDTTGTLAWTTGAENASPVAPNYPANKLAICELYNVVSETALYDNENQQTNQGYIYNDVRPTTTAGPILSAVPDSIIPSAADTYDLGSVGSEWNNIYGKALYQSGVLVTGSKFGGTGTDGALSITSGTTTINLGGAAVVIKNYTSISITGTGQLAFSNPNANGTVVILKSLGNVTITSNASPTIDCSNVGAAGSNATAVFVAGSSTPGGGSSIGGTSTPSGGGGGGASVVSNGTAGSTSGTSGGSAGSAPTNFPYAGTRSSFTKVYVQPGAGGGASGGANNGSPAGVNGGAGGGGLYIECNGALNFTGSSSISVAGQTGTVGVRSGNGGSGGGGGGGGGSCVILAASITSQAGTINVSGGSGGGVGAGSGTPGGAGGAGGNGTSYVGINTEF